MGRRTPLIGTDDQRFNAHRYLTGLPVSGGEDPDLMAARRLAALALDGALSQSTTKVAGRVTRKLWPLRWYATCWAAERSTGRYGDWWRLGLREVAFAGTRRGAERKLAQRLRKQEPVTDLNGTPGA